MTEKRNKKKDWPQRGQKKELNRNGVSFPAHPSSHVNSSIDAIKWFADKSIGIPFGEQIENSISKMLHTGEHLCVAVNTATDLNLSFIKNVSDFPLLMKQSVVKKAEAHSVSIEMIKRLPELMRKSPFAFEGNKENSVVVMIDEKTKEGQAIAVPIFLDKKKGQFIINEIASVHGREFLQNTLDNAAAAGREFFLNERSERWAKVIGIDLPARSSRGATPL